MTHWSIFNLSFRSIGYFLPVAFRATRPVKLTLLIFFSAHFILLDEGFQQVVVDKRSWICRRYKCTLCRIDTKFWVNLLSPNLQPFRVYKTFLHHHHYYYYYHYQFILCWQDVKVLQLKDLHNRGYSIISN